MTKYAKNCSNRVTGAVPRMREMRAFLDTVYITLSINLPYTFYRER